MRDACMADRSYLTARVCQPPRMMLATWKDILFLNTLASSKLKGFSGYRETDISIDGNHT
jgi:hypothetical protein